jgi:hypothetical protein
MHKENLVALIIVCALAILVITFLLGFWGIPIAAGVTAGITYFVLRKRGSRMVRKIAFVIGILMVLGGTAWLSFDIIMGML